MVDREQPSFSSGGFDVHRKPTRRERFFTKIDQIIPWGELVAIVEPYYPKTGQPGRPVTPLIQMIKLYFIQIWFGLSDPQTEDMIHDSAAVEKFLGLDLSRDCPPDEAAISQFRHLIERHKLGPKLSQVVNAQFEKAGVRVRMGKTVEAMAIKTEPSAQNEGEKFDQGLDSTRIDN